MIESLREIGVFSLQDRGKGTDDALSILLENPASDYYQKVVAICFRQEDSSLRFSDVIIETMDSFFEKYLYKRKASAGANYTPSALVAGKGISGTFLGRIVAWAKNCIEREGVIGDLAKCIIDEKDTIEQVLVEKDRLYDLGNTLLTVQIGDNFLGEIKAFRDYFIKTYYETKGAVAVDNGVCSVCGQKGFVMGNEKPWTFYSLDKPGFIAGGFDDKTGWKNFPICKTCSLLVEEGKQYAVTNLNYRFSGIPYFLLPKSIFNSSKTLEEALFYLAAENRSRLRDVRDLQGLADDEDEILQFASEQRDAINYNFLFYESTKAKFSILLYLQDVLPSTIRKLFDVKFKVEKFPVFKEAYREKNELKDVRFTFNNLRRFVPTREGFLNLVDKIFKRRSINYAFLLGRFLAHLRNRCANGFYTRPDTLKAWQILLFLQNLGILYHQEKGEKLMATEVIQNDVKRKVETFFSQFESTFNSDAKRAVFLTGVLTNFLLQIQHSDRGNDPFRKNLKGLKMRQRDILQIFPKAQNKLEEYEKNYYTQLEQVISEYFAKAGSDWKISDDEINFYFLLGMDLSDARTETKEPVFKADSDHTQKN